MLPSTAPSKHSVFGLIVFRFPQQVGRRNFNDSALKKENYFPCRPKLSVILLAMDFNIIS